MKESYLSDEFFGRLETLSLNLRAKLMGYYGGKHRVNSYGQTVDFADYREYQPGDDIRRIDWNLFGRLRKHFLKLFTDERQMHIQIFLDCSASMGAYIDKANYATGIAAAMGFLAIHNMDKISFNFINGDYSKNPYGLIVGKNKFFQIVKDLKNIKYEGDVDLFKAITSCQNIGTNDGLTIIISDFFTDSDWKKSVDFLCHKKRQVMLIQILNKEEVNPTYAGRTTLIDSETKDISDSKNLKLRITKSMQDAYSKALKEYIADLDSFCISRGVDFMSITSDMPIEKVIFGDLLKVGAIS